MSGVGGGAAPVPMPMFYLESFGSVAFVECVIWDKWMKKGCGVIVNETIFRNVSIGTIARA